MTVQRAAVDTQMLSHAFCRTQTGRQRHIDAFAGAVPHRGIGAGRHSVEILLNLPRDCRIRSGHAGIDVTRQTDDPVALLTKLDARAEKPAMRIRSGRRRVRKPDRLRPPTLAEQLLQASVDEAQREFDSLTYRNRSPRLNGEGDGRQLLCLVNCQPQPVAVQMHVACKGFVRLADRGLLADQQGKDPEIGQAAALRQPESEVGPSDRAAESSSKRATALRGILSSGSVRQAGGKPCAATIW